MNELHFKKWESEGGKWHLSLIAANNEIIFTTEGYTRKQGADESLDLVKQAVFGLVPVVEERKS